MNPTCPKCGGEMKLIPAGLSKKTGKPYQEFYSCKEWKCGGTVNPSKMTQSPTSTPIASPASNSGSTDRIIELLDSIDKRLEAIEYNSLKDENGNKIPF